MKVRFHFSRSGMLVVLAVALIAVSCNKKPKAVPQPVPVLPAVTLDSTRGAMLVVFPKRKDLHPVDFHAAVLVYPDSANVHVTHNLRVPLGDSQSILVMDLPPGNYRALAYCWQMVGQPYAGGKLVGVQIKPGQITILRARDLGTDRLPFPHTALIPAGQLPWDSAAAQKLPTYIAQIVRTTERG
jgi:hypothetical protein